MNFLQIFDYGLNSVVASGPLHPTRAVADRRALEKRGAEV
jgi:hypothetical protein